MAQLNKPEYSLLYLYCGQDFYVNITLYNDANQVMDITEFTGECWMRKSYYYNKDVYQIQVNKLLPYNQGTFQLFLSAEETLNIKSGRYVIDFFVKNENNQIYKLIDGIVVAYPAATQKLVGATGAVGASGIYPIQKY